jgi:beta-N-acetylhexosaminidase
VAFLVALALASLALAAAPADLTARQLAGQRVIVGFSGTSAPRSLLRRIHRGELGGVILFSTSIRSRPQVRRLTRSLQRARPDGLPPLIVSIDQEGGQVKRLSGAPTLSPAQLGARNDPALARRQGLATARNLRSVGVNVNLAPVLDVARRGSIMRRQGRSYGGSATRVTRIGGEFARGLSAGGVAATAKHFPGLGAATKNQDLEVNRINVPLTELRRTDERPFKALASDLPLLMLSSAIYPALSGRPAVFSRRIATTELRKNCGYKGVTISDALDAPAMARYGSLRRRARLAVVDLLLYAQDGPAPPVDRAATQRVLALRANL